MEIISRKDAIKKGLSRYYTGKPCKRGHICERCVSNGCLECSKIKWTKSNQKRKKPKHPRQEALELNHETYTTGIPCRKFGHSSPRYTKNGACIECCKILHEERMKDEDWRENRNARNRDWYEQEHVKESRKNYSFEYRRMLHEEGGERLTRARATKRMSQSKRRKLVKKSTYECFNDQLKDIYFEAQQTQEKLQSCVVSDDPYDLVVNVDHIIPVNNKYVCGLNIPINLQIIPAKENFKKQSKFKPYTEYY